MGNRARCAQLRADLPVNAESDIFLGPLTPRSTYEESLQPLSPPRETAELVQIRLTLGTQSSVLRDLCCKDEHRSAWPTALQEV